MAFAIYHYFCFFAHFEAKSHCLFRPIDSFGFAISFVNFELILDKVPCELVPNLVVEKEAEHCSACWWWAASGQACQTDERDGETR